MKRISMNRWFSLPRIGSDSFSELMRSRVHYDPRLGFRFTSETDASRALEIISSAIGEQVKMERECFICEKPLEDGEKVGSVICAECLALNEAYELYAIKFAKLMEEQ